MSLTIDSEVTPLEADSDGTFRVSGTRVSLDSIVSAFDDGATPEQIVQKYDTLQLDDVYSVITFILRHRSDVDAYLAKQDEVAAAVREEIESRWSTAGVRERLMRRLEKKPPSC